jgi:F-type H+-transporting ATPase subunit b
MQIDWFTLIAQIVNLLILLALLKWLLFDRVVNAMEERQKRISSRFDEAEQTQQAAQEKQHAYEQKHSELEHEREDILKQARQEANETRDEMIEKAREEIENKRRSWLDNLRASQEQILNDLRDMAGHEVYAIARQVLRELADEDLERQTVRVFVSKVRKLDDEHRSQLAEEFENREEQPLIRSAFELDDDSRSEIENALREVLELDVELEYEQDDELICGIAFEGRSMTLQWSVDAYVDSLTQSFQRRIEEQAQEVKPSEEEHEEADATEDETERAPSGEEEEDEGETSP